MHLKLMYITNNPDVALIAQKNGVERIWIDLETEGKEERQKGIDSVKSHHCTEDIKKIKPLLTTSELLVRINPWSENSKNELENVLSCGADAVMLPMWKTAGEVEKFLNTVGSRATKILLLETKEAVECLDDVLTLKGIDEIHIGLNDLHLSYGLTFMFELLSNGVVEKLCDKIRAAQIPYGFGGIAGIGGGMLPAENIVLEHKRLGSRQVILSRSFCNAELCADTAETEKVFRENIRKLRDFEKYATEAKEDVLWQNKIEVEQKVKAIVEIMTERKNNG